VSRSIIHIIFYSVLIMTTGAFQTNERTIQVALRTC